MICRVVLKRKDGLEMPVMVKADGKKGAARKAKEEARRADPEGIYKLKRMEIL